MTLACIVGPTGISSPSYADILANLQSGVQAIFGSDIYISPDSQDGQLLAIIAQAIYDSNQAMIAAYNSFSPTFAQGDGLSSVVKINGIRRAIASNSTATGNVVGVEGTTIVNGVVKDENGNLWNLPPSVTIPGGGSIPVTVTAQALGNIVAPAGTINLINNPTLGWQSFVSTTDAIPGAPIETDAALRARQTTAAALPSQTPLEGLLAAIAGLNGVTRVAVYENSTGSVDANGAPAHSIYVVVEGGDLTEIATTIGQKKTPGAATFGTTAEPYTDPLTGIDYTINFFVLAYTAVAVAITLKAQAGWSTANEVDIQNAVSAYINSLSIGQPVQLSRMWGVAYLNGAAEGNTFELTAITLNGSPADVAITFNHAAQCPPSSVSITVVP